MTRVWSREKDLRKSGRKYFKVFRILLHNIISTAFLKGSAKVEGTLPDMQVFTAHDLQGGPKHLSKTPLTTAVLCAASLVFHCMSDVGECCWCWIGFFSFEAFDEMWQDLKSYTVLFLIFDSVHRY